MLNFHFTPLTKGIAAIGLAAVAFGAVGDKSLSARPLTPNDMSLCGAGKGPAVLVNVQGVTAGGGKVRVQIYPATKAAWLEKGRWLHRIEARSSGGNMQFCVPVPKAGSYAVAVRHDKNNNGKTDLSGDGGGFSGNPKVNAFRAVLGKSVVPVSSATFSAGADVTRISILMRYR
jgi:uncharacterized protein (DUF2141 family)